MKALVVGAGSIGSRHAGNLVALGHEVLAVDPAADGRARAVSLGASAVATLDEGLAWGPDVAFVCTYSNEHIAPALACVEAGCHLFVEKPLSTTMDGVTQLIESVERRGVVDMVGCNFRFHPGVEAVKRALESEPGFERPLWGSFEYGYYLPFAKPDHRGHYMSNRSMGGDVLFDVIHELDTAVWLLGEPEAVTCSKARLGELTVDADDVADLMVRFASGARASVHMDYLQHAYTRRCRVVCADATVVWDFTRGAVGRVSVAEPEWKWEPVEAGIYYNEMYVDELRHFMDCVERGVPTINPLSAAADVVRLALAAERSSAGGAWEELRDE